ncbi:uncharacterized protein LOC106651436 [Trichogramma pretiosum]|uniref:uncharacterized protein LOC106651436 n=1 Tax=Trichogramma pretiosum TaxID=7493 RepID=UPI0006C971A6|nr:uncharacterized protein LOC106651436 [Trichogramma pretiosum]
MIIYKMRVAIARARLLVPIQRPASMLLLLLALTLASSEALRMTALRIPQHVVLNQTVRMECDFSLDRESLYSVKWYKDGHEFYRYVPSEEPRVHIFPLDGVAVDRRSSTEKIVVLHRVNDDSTGRYRCEVSAEAPAFHTVSDHADMTVVVLSEHGPTITGAKSKYQAGDIVNINCTSAPSKPAALLMWYVNEEPVDMQYLKGPYIVDVDKRGLETVVLILEFQAWSNHFRHGDMKLKCLATISSVYRRSKEHRVVGDHGILKQPMESRETRAQSHMHNNENRVRICTLLMSCLSLVVVYFHQSIC